MKALWLALAAILLVGCDTTSSARPRTAYATASQTASQTASKTASSAPLCPEAGVKLSVSEVDGAMGLRAVGVTLRNCGQSVYSVNGYPLIQVLDADHKVLEVSVLNGTDNVYHIDQYSGAPKRIDVAPGASAYAVMLWRNLTTDAETVLKGAYVNIAAVSGQDWQTSPLNVDLGNTGKLAVTPWMSQ